MEGSRSCVALQNADTKGLCYAAGHLSRNSCAAALRETALRPPRERTSWGYPALITPTSAVSAGWEGADGGERMLLLGEFAAGPGLHGAHRQFRVFRVADLGEGEPVRLHHLELAGARPVDSKVNQPVAG